MQFAKMRYSSVIGILYLTTLTSGDQPNVVIIGAGASGIAAASKLFENGFQNVTILEAEDRIGGRVHTTWFDESWIDLGGQWVSGARNNIVFELASPLGVLGSPQGMKGSEFTLYNSEGYNIPDSIGSKLVDIYFHITFFPEDSNGRNGSIGEYMTRRMNTEMKKYPAVNDTLAGQLITIFERITMDLDASDSWYDVSVKRYEELWICPGNPLINWKDRGYGTILDILMKKYPNPEDELPVRDNTILNSEVVNIDYNSTEGKAKVVTSSGQQYMADHVIVTPSLGVLKAQYETLFTPELPEYKVNTIKGLGFGTIARIYLSFEEPWWPINSMHMGYIWNDNDRQEYENDPDKKWLLDVLGSSPVVYRPRLLCSWVSGASARHMETLPEAQVLNQTFALMNKFLGKSFNITRPTGIIRTKWYSNKHFRGAYSSRSMESERADVWADQLAAPLLVNNTPIVLFAGEATHAHYYGSAHGAIETGFREANRLIKMYTNLTE